MRAYRVLLQFGDRVLAVGRFGLKMRKVGVYPVDQASGAGSAGLQAGAAVEDDHQVTAECLRLLGLSDTQAFASGRHQDDGDNTPGYPEHGQKRTDTVRPEGSEDVLNEIAERHARFRRGPSGNGSGALRGFR